MEQKERLIEIIQSSVGGCARNWAEVIADGLIANGVIVAPMPMADWLRKELTEYVHERCMEEL